MLLKPIKLVCKFSYFSLKTCIIFISLTVCRFDEQSKYAFVGDYSGHISVLKVKNNCFDLITTFKGHSGKYVLGKHLFYEKHSTY